MSSPLPAWQWSIAQDRSAPTGEPHLGNYVGAILPALDLADSYESIYFIADYHALTTIRDPALLRHYTRTQSRRLSTELRSRGPSICGNS
ncbi:hypothetical protein ACLQ24_25045 [Micromonospora sp. DT4]|uniref:hypothetical protein n=1 Tax=Micromonospora sp. DT4 TaxID=3393438 RepID=UPI003CECBBAC